MFTEPEKQEARTHLPNLREHPGWKFIEKGLDKKIAHFAEELRERKDFTSLAEVYRLQDQIKDHEEFKRFPDILLLATEADPETPEEEDIYDQPDLS
jgi:hypothetical protein